SAKQIETLNPSAVSGIYWIDPDGGDHANAFQTFADMTTAGGGWTLGLRSLAGSESPSTDIIATLGSLSGGYVRDLSDLAVDADAQIRHVIKNASGTTLFDGYYTGRYHNALPTAPSWTVLTGSLAAGGLTHNLG